MKHRFEIDLTIEPKLFNFFNFLEETFKIKITHTSIEKVFFDADEDQVNEKEYVFFSERKSWFIRPLMVQGKAGHY